LPIVLTEPTLPNPPPLGLVSDWVLDTGNQGEAFAWRHHLIQAGLDPDQYRTPSSMTIRTVSGRLTVPILDTDLWLVSNLPGLRLDAGPRSDGVRRWRSFSIGPFAR
jgi:hypothetical protein